jgi:hypothetical protein
MTEISTSDCETCWKTAVPRPHLRQADPGGQLSPIDLDRDQFSVYPGSVLNIWQRSKIMKRLVTYVLFVCLTSSVALGQTPKKHLLIYRTEHDARRHCHNDTIVWANTKTHALYLLGDQYAHTHGGYTCESKARSIGYRAPTAHA